MAKGEYHCRAPWRAGYLNRKLLLQQTLCHREDQTQSEGKR